MRVADHGVALQRGQRPGGADQRQLAAQAVGAQRHAELRRALEAASGTSTSASASRAATIRRAQLGLVACPLRRRSAAGSRSKASRRRTTSIRVGRSVGRADLDREAEAVEQLRPQLALLRVAAADQHEAGGVADAQALALDHVLARGRDVEQQVDQVVLEQVDLVDVEKAAIGAGQQAGLERLLAVRQRALEVERADDAVLGGAQRQVDHRHRRDAAAARGRCRRARQSVAQRAGRRRVAA